MSKDKQKLTGRPPLVGAVADAVDSLASGIASHADRATQILPEPVRKVLELPNERGRAFAIRANASVDALTTSITSGLEAVRTEKGRKKLVSTVRKQTRGVFQDALGRLEILTDRDVTTLRKRIKTLERRLESLDPKPRRSSTKRKST